MNSQLGRLALARRIATGSLVGPALWQLELHAVQVGVSPETLVFISPSTPFLSFGLISLPEKEVEKTRVN